MTRRGTKPREYWEGLADTTWGLLAGDLTEDDSQRIKEAAAALSAALAEVSLYLETGRRIGEELEALCPFHEDQRLGNFRVNMKTGFFMCWACGAAGGVHRLLGGLGIGDPEIKKLLKGVDFDAISLFLEQRLHSKETGVASIPSIPEGILSKFPYRPRLYLERGHSAKLLDQLEVSYDPEHMRVVFPIRRASGDLVAIQSRALDPDSIRWKFYKDELKRLLPADVIRDYGLEDYEPPRRIVFFNEHNVFMSLAAGRLKRPLVLVEGPGHAMRVMAAGYPSVASFGTHLADIQLSRLMHAFRQIRVHQGARPRIILATDGDAAGRASAIRTSLDIGPTVDVHLARIPPGHDPEDLTARELRGVLQGAPLFEDLVNERSLEGRQAAGILQEELDRRARKSEGVARRRRWKEKRDPEVQDLLDLRDEPFRTPLSLEKVAERFEVEEDDA